MFEVNNEQIKGALRWLVSAFGAGVAGWFASKGWFTTDQVMGFLNGPFFLGAGATFLGLVVGWLARSKPNLIKVVDNLPGVAGVITTPTTEGVALANSVPSNTVVAAGTPGASAVAKAA